MRERIGRYEIVEELGRGAMGAVYKARDPQIDRTVAIKNILAASIGSEEMERFKSRFYREAQAAGKMSHPGIVTIHDIAEDENGQPYLVMEFIEGSTLSSLLAPPAAGMPAERLSFDQALDIGIQAAQALDYAHKRGVVHRDIKPANLLITYDGRVKITDFGIAKLEGTQLTQTGMMVGTPAFMSPEQITGTGVDGRSDIFSLGATLYWMFTGEKPFTGDTVSALSFKIVYEMPPPAKQRNSSLPLAVDRILTRCLAKKSEERYKTAGELAADLEALREKKRGAAAAPAPPKSEATASGVPLPPMRDATAPPRPVGPVSMPAAEAPKKPAAPTGARVVSPARSRLDPKLLGGIGAGTVLVLALVAYVVWPSKPEAPPQTSSEAVSQPASAPAQPASTTTPKTAGSSTAAKTAESGESRATGIPAGMAQLNIECRHDFRTAKIEIYSGEKLLAEGVLTGSVRSTGGLAGSFRTSKQIAAGTHSIRVLVASPLYNYEEQKEITGVFRAGAARTLLISVATSGSERWLSLSWR